MEWFAEQRLTKDVLDNLIIEAKDYAYSNGVIMRTSENISSQDAVTHVSFTLFPSPVPKSCFEAALSVQSDFNILMHKVAHDYQFMKECLQSVVKADNFTRNMWNIYEMVYKEGINQPISLAMNRSDYMFDSGTDASQNMPTKGSKDYKLRQIEFNTMAASFGGLSPQLQHLHKFTLTSIGKLEEHKHIPLNKSVAGLAKGLVTAWKAYNNPSAVIVFLVLDEERNIYDQRLLTYAMGKENPNVKVIRRTLKNFTERGTISSNKCLHIDNMEVAIVYQRCLYIPSHFNEEQDWKTRLMIERSKAIKCPSINYHLAGTKKIQQVLAQPGILEKYLDNQEAINRIRGTFAGQYSLDMNKEGDDNTEMGIENPHLFVLKPQREGGGNNVFGDDVKHKLLELQNSDERSAYILMERIYPMELQNYIVRTGKPVERCQMVSELGIFGVLIGTKDNITVNEECGYILRTKTLGTDEGGVATGFSALDSPYLV